MLKIDEIHTYYGQSHILQGVSLEIAAGECVALLGRNGAGKTTTMRSIMGMTPPRRGRIALDGAEITGLSTHQIARAGIGYVPSGRRVFSELTVRQNLDLAAHDAKGTVGPWTVERVLEMFPKLVELSGRGAGFLSGGEQQMLKLGRALLRNPKLLLLDEPTTNLDVNGREALETALKNYKGAVCVVSHDVTFVRNIAEHIIAIDDTGVTRYPGGYDYYQEKIETGNGKPATGTLKQTSGSEPAKSAPKGKDARKARAQQREAENALRKIERKIDQLTEEQTALSEEMMSRRDADFATINARLSAIQTEIQSSESPCETPAETLG